VAAQPGHTKDLQTIQLERGIKVVDSPGVVFDDDDFDNGGKSKKKGTVLLRNAIKVEDVGDPIALVEQILSRTDRELLKKIYNLPQVEETFEFLTMMALTTGRLLKVVSIIHQLWHDNDKYHLGRDTRHSSCCQANSHGLEPRKDPLHVNSTYNPCIIDSIHHPQWRRPYHRTGG